MFSIQSERLFRPLIEKSPDAVILIDANGEITYANPAAGGLLGYADHQAIRRLSFSSFIHYEDYKIFENLLSQGNAIGEIRLQHRGGSGASCQITVTDLLNDPDVNGILLNLKDISEQKEAENSLQTQRDLLQNLVLVARATSEAAELEDMLQNLLRMGRWLTQAVNGRVFLFDQVGRLTFTRSFYGRLPPGQAQKLLTSGLSGWVVEHEKPALILDTRTDERWLELPSKGYVTRSALAIPILSGNDLLAILVLTHSQPGHFNPGHLKTLEAASGQMAMAIKNTQLYSDAQSNLADLNALIAASQDGIVLINPDGKTKVINGAALKLGGLNGEPADWIGKSIIDFYRQGRRTAPELISVLIAESRRILIGDASGNEGEIQTATNDIQWLHLPVTINDQIIGRLLILRDITKQRNLERQREELTNMIVHDLRNPVSAISGIVAMLKPSPGINTFPDDFEQIIQLAERNVSKMLDLVQEILHVSQLENDQLPLHKTQLNIESLINDIVQLQSPIVIAKEISLKANIDPNLPSILADEQLLQRVLQNLVVNAAKFSSRYGSIAITARLVGPDSDQIQISVQDDGIGIPDELKGRVFDKFVTGRNAKRGSGLGLTFCRLVVQAHNGRIWAESEGDQGSTFHFTLPVSTGENPQLSDYPLTESS